MRFLRYRDGERLGLAVANGSGMFTGWLAGESGYPGDLTPRLLGATSLEELAHSLMKGKPVDPQKVQRLPPIARPGKVLCVGLNYKDHAAEVGQEAPQHPTVFVRFETSLVGDGGAMIRPTLSERFDFEGELMAVIGKPGRHIRKSDALKHVAGYSVFNDGSLRDYQFRTTQWTLGKNFDATGALGPVLVGSHDLPEGARGLSLQTRLNGTVVQKASTDSMFFDVATLIARLSDVMTLEPGDLIATGTPAGIGAVRTPPLWMKPGDVCEVEIEEVGLLRNVIQGELSPPADPG